MNDPVLCWLPFQQRVIWRRLNRHPYEYPSVDDIAHDIGVRPLEYRRFIRRHRTAPLRDVICWACTTYAAVLIARGHKVEYAMRRVGMSNRTNFNRNMRDYIGGAPHAYRGQDCTGLLAAVDPPCRVPSGPEDWIPLDEPTRPLTPRAASSPAEPRLSRV